MKFLRVGICALVALGVSTHGGVEEWARAILETGAGLLFLAWSLRLYLKREEKLFFSPLLLPLAGLSLIVLGQLFFHSTFSPFHTRSDLLSLLTELFFPL